MMVADREFAGVELRQICMMVIVEVKLLVVVRMIKLRERVKACLERLGTRKGVPLVAAKDWGSQ